MQLFTLLLQVRREHPSGYRLITVGDLAEANRAVWDGSGFGYLSMAIGAVVLALVAVFLVRWIAAIIREKRDMRPPEMPPAPPPTRVRDVTLQEPPEQPRTSEKAESRWKSL